MAELGILICATSGCGRPLAQVPGPCPECRTFWASGEELAAEWARRQADDERSAGNAPAGGDGVTHLTDPLRPARADTADTGAGTAVDWFQEATRDTSTVALAVSDALLVLPEGSPITLGRHSDWVQIARLFDDLRQVAGAIGEAARGVSRRHATVTLLGGKVRIADLGSRNGTWIRGREIVGGPVVKELPVVFTLGVPDQGLRVEVRTARPGEDPSRWSGERRG